MIDPLGQPSNMYWPVTIQVTVTEPAIACEDGTRMVRRTTDQPARNLKKSAGRARQVGSPLSLAWQGPSMRCSPTSASTRPR